MTTRQDTSNGHNKVEHSFDMTTITDRKAATNITTYIYILFSLTFL